MIRIGKGRMEGVEVEKKGRRKGGMKEEKGEGEEEERSEGLTLKQKTGDSDLRAS
jgi:hypothetical protein